VEHAYRQLQKRFEEILQIVDEVNSHYLDLVNLMHLLNHLKTYHDQNL